MPTVLRALLLAALLTLVPVGIGVVVADDTSSAPEPPPPAYEGTALADFDTGAAVVQRAPFCDRIHPDAVREALGAEGDLTAYGNGEDTDVLPGGDVAHEYGCRYAAAGGAEARGWVFAPPVTAEKAAELVRAAPGKGCRVQRSAAAYGAPSVATLCTSKGRSTASYRGLFGDAWLACSLSGPAGAPAAELLEAAGRWCVAVAEAAAPTAT